jgi:hypothetical protein
MCHGPQELACLAWLSRTAPQCHSPLCRDQCHNSIYTALVVEMILDVPIRRIPSAARGKVQLQYSLFPERFQGTVIGFLHGAWPLSLDMAGSYTHVVKNLFGLRERDPQSFA